MSIHLLALHPVVSTPPFCLPQGPVMVSGHWTGPHQCSPLRLPTSTEKALLLISLLPRLPPAGHFSGT